MIVETAVFDKETSRAFGTPTGILSVIPEMFFSESKFIDKQFLNVFCS